MVARISVEKIGLIIKLTGKMGRKQIAKKVGCSKSTVYIYQKAYSLV